MRSESVRLQGGQDVAGLGGNGDQNDIKLSSVSDESICEAFFLSR